MGNTLSGCARRPDTPDKSQTRATTARTSTSSRGSQSHDHWKLGLGSNITPHLAPTHVRPTDASIKLTENCQARCVTCDYWKHRWHDHIDTKAAIRLIDRLGHIGVTTLRFTGGEPLLRRDFFDILGEIDLTPFTTIGVQTNGLLLGRLAKKINDSPATTCLSHWMPSATTTTRSAASAATSIAPSQV